MYIVMTLLVITAWSLHQSSLKDERSLSAQIRYMRLVFSLSIAVFIPALIQYTFWDVSEYNLFLFHPVLMLGVGTIFSLGLQLLVYGKLSTNTGVE